MSKNSRVSVLVVTRTKDRPLFLKRALQSLKAQTYENYEHLILNDGGNQQLVDEAVQTVDGPHVRVIHREKASGRPDSLFNEAIQAVDSDFVAIHDDDDSWNPESLERAIGVLKSGYHGVLMRTEKVVERVDQDTIRKVSSRHYKPRLRAVSLYQQCNENLLTPIAFVYSREAYDAVGGYDDSLPIIGDWEFGIRFMQKYDVEYLDPGFPLAFYHHRRNRQNSFSSHDHLYYFTKVANKYLREEMKDGRVGPGLIMSQNKYMQSSIADAAEKFLPNRMVQSLKKRIRG